MFGYGRMDILGRSVELLLPPSGRAFQLAAQIGLLRHRELLDTLVAQANLSSDEARRLARVGLAKALFLQGDLENARSLLESVRERIHAGECGAQVVIQRIVMCQAAQSAGLGIESARKLVGFVGQHAMEVSGSV